MDSKIKKHSALRDGFFIAGTVLLLFFSLWKSRYGLGIYDEAFYLTIPYRMCHGDKLFLNEWHVSQLSALLQYPLMKLYLLVHSGTDGIVLDFRHIYIAVNFAGGLLAYRRLRKYGAGAAAAVLLYLLYAPYNIMALSYNSLGLLCGFLCAVYLATAAKNTDYAVSGLFFAGLVLCQPLMLVEFAIVYPVLICAALILRRRELLRGLLWFLLGCVILAAPVLIYFIFSVGISNILAAIPLMMNDPEHNMGELLSVSFIYRSIVDYYLPEMPAGLKFISRSVLKVFYFGFVPICAAVLLDRGRRRRAALYLSLSALLCTLIGAAYMLLYPYKSTYISYVNYLLFPWLLHGICLMPLLTKSERWQLSLFYALAFLHALSFLTSNQGGNVFSIALLPACLASIMLSIKYCSSLGRAKAVPVFICTAVSAALLLYVRAGYCFMSPPVSQFDAQCVSGPAAGICAAEDDAVRCDSVSLSMKSKNFDADGNTLFLATDPLFYLCTDTGLAQYSAWLSFNIDSTPSRLEAYYSLNPDKRPDTIVIEKAILPELESDAAADWAAEHGFSFEEDDMCFFMSRLTD
ncbi:MAG: hypothetical protein SPE93_01160 [Candidatus Limivicinus sp.]|nr:hypothetical protein [Candidatus Limivicinus sp.]